MLVLGRKEGEEVVIDVDGTLIVITVIESGNGKTKLGIEAPKRYNVDRKEVYEKRNKEVLGGDVTGR